MLPTVPEAQVSRPEAPAGVILKLREPPAFAGHLNQDVQVWLGQVEHYLQQFENQPVNKVAYVISLLDGDAQAWWQQQLKQRNGLPPSTLEELSELLQRRFADTFRKDRARAKLTYIRQRPKEEVAAYVSRFRRLADRVNTSDERMLCHTFIWGLHESIWRPVVLINPSTLEETIVAALRVDVSRQRSKSKEEGTSPRKRGSRRRIGGAGAGDTRLSQRTKTGTQIGRRRRGQTKIVQNAVPNLGVVFGRRGQRGTVQYDAICRVGKVLVATPATARINEQLIDSAVNAVSEPPGSEN